MPSPLDNGWLILVSVIGVPLTLLGLTLTFEFRRDRRISNFKELIAADADYWEQRASRDPSGTISLERNLKIRRIPRQPWRVWKRCRGWWRSGAPLRGRKIVHCRAALLLPRSAGAFNVRLLWHDTANRLDVVNRVARDYECDADLTPETFTDDPRRHLIVQVGDALLIVEPTVRRRHWDVPHTVAGDDVPLDAQ